MTGYTQKEHHGRDGNNPPASLSLFQSNLDIVHVSLLVENAKHNAQIFHNDRITANQIRNFYGSVDKLKLRYAVTKNDEQLTHDLWLLRPQLAYAKGRNRTTSRFCISMENAIAKVIDAAQIGKAASNFFIYVESVVAYHKFYGDK